MNQKDTRTLCTTYKLGQLFFHTYSLTYLNKDPSVLLKVIEFEQVDKYKNKGLDFFQNTMYMKFPEKACTFMLKSHVKDINDFAHFHIFIHIFLKPIYKVKHSEKHKATSKHFQNTHSFRFWMMYIQSAWKYLNNCMSSFFHKMNINISRFSDDDQLFKKYDKAKFLRIAVQGVNRPWKMMYVIFPIAFNFLIVSTLLWETIKK